MKDCDINELYQRLTADKSCLLIDVREYAEYAGGRVAGAKPIPYGDLERRSAEINQNKTIFLICRSGRRSKEAQEKLARFGITDTRNVAGGLEAWKAAGLPIESDAKPVWSLERQVRFTAGLIVLTGVILSLLLHPYLLAISGFVGAGLMFAAATDSCAMGMALAKMPWNKRLEAVDESAG